MERLTDKPCWARHCLILAALLTLVLGTKGQAENAMRKHPFLFVTQADIARIKDSSGNPEYAQYLSDLKTGVEKLSVDALPKLETEWWNDIKDKSWKETYPEINYHTGKVPKKWSRAALNCARAALLFPDSDFAGKGRTILLGLSEFTFEYEHYDVGLNYATLGNECFQAYDMLYDSFDVDERERMDAFFRRMLDAIVKNDEYWVEHKPGGPLNNHYAWHKLAMALHGLFYDEPELVEAALTGPKGILESLQYGFKDEGLWLESSLSYQFVQTVPMTILAEALHNAGSEFSLWDYRTDDGRTLRQAYDALIEIVFPDQTLPNIGDCYGGRNRISRRPDYETLYARFLDPRYAWLLKQGSPRLPQALWEGAIELGNVQPPQLKSQLWPEHGYVMLRQDEGDEYWTGNGWSLFGTFADSSVHHQKDRLSIMLFGNNHHWLIDCEARSSSHHAFSSHVQKELNRSSVSHNLMLVDGLDQKATPTCVDFVEFSSLEGVRRTTIGDLSGQLYDGVRQMRTLIVCDEYVLDLYQVSSEEEHDYSWMTHVNGIFESSSIEETGWMPHKFPDGNFWKWLRDPMKASFERQFHAAYSAGNKRFQIDLATSAPVEVIRYGFPQTDAESPDTWPSLCVSATERQFWVAAVYRMDQATSKDVRISLSPGEMNHWEVRVEIADRSKVHIIPGL